MSFYDRGAYSYQSDSSRFSNSLNEEVNGVKRKKRRYNNKKRTPQNAGAGSAPGPTFKEPIPPLQRSPSVPLRDTNMSPQGRPRKNPFAYERPNPRPRHAFEVQDMPEFVEREHKGPQWQWDPYFNQCKNWQEKHKLAYYRSRCLALEFENQMLFEQVNSLINENCVFAEERGEVPKMKLPFIPALDVEKPSATTSKNQGAQASQKKQGKHREAQTNKDPNTELEFEVSEEMMNFLEKSMRHKLNLKNKKEQEKGQEEMDVDTVTEAKDGKGKQQGPKEPMGLKRKEELDQLYGKSSALIQGLETSIQLNFNRNCDTYKPEVWLAVPLNPETVTC